MVSVCDAVFGVGVCESVTVIGKVNAPPEGGVPCQEAGAGIESQPRGQCRAGNAGGIYSAGPLQLITVRLPARAGGKVVGERMVMPDPFRTVRLICLVAICASWSVTLNVGVNNPVWVVVPERVPDEGVDRIAVRQTGGAETVGAAAGAAAGRNRHSALIGRARRAVGQRRRGDGQHRVDGQGVRLAAGGAPEVGDGDAELRGDGRW